MSSDVDDDQVLPESLQKLEIVPVLSHPQSTCNTNNERNQNPFFSELSTANGIDDRITKDLFGPSCSNCKSNDEPCSVNSNSADDKDDVAHRVLRNQGKSCRLNKLNKFIYFRQRDREKSNQILSEKKLTILREPILKSIGRSVYYNGNQSKLCCEPKSTIEQKLPKDELINTTNLAWFGKVSCSCANELDVNAVATVKPHGVSNNDGTSIDAHKNECRPIANTADPNNVMIHRIQEWQLNDNSTVDFKSLVNDCSNLTLSTQHADNNTISELHKTKNFQVLQANQIESTSAVAASTSEGNDTHTPNNSIHATLSAAVNSAMNCSLSSNSSNSSSCSQQARMNSSNCDVTIDELASYIEFQLHLPKPMSSNVYEAMFS